MNFRNALKVPEDFWKMVNSSYHLSLDNSHPAYRAPCPVWRSPTAPARPQNGPDRHLTRENRRNPHLTRRLHSEIVKILNLRVPYPQLTRTLRDVFASQSSKSVQIRNLRVRCRFLRALKNTCSLAQFGALQNLRHAT